MSTPAIVVRNIGKRYAVGRVDRNSLRAEIARAFKSGSASPEEFWAVNDVSFVANRGEAIGIIGRNGSGKSTLLKLLSRITEPTVGSAEIYGRVGCLLEVGTGFHPELSGRDNVFLNGTILGMTRAEIRHHFDEIVAFAGVEKFIDTPVKHYSSGMYLRLAFAVAAHLRTDILIVDEVLAVGDASFQKKCLDKMDQVAHQGRTVLFVSHSMPTVTRLCSRVILLDGGKVIADGQSGHVVSRYLQSGLGTTAARDWTGKAAPGDAVARLRAARVVDDQSDVQERFDVRARIGIEIEYEVLTPGHAVVASFHCITEEGICAFVGIDTAEGAQRTPKPVGVYSTRAWIPSNFLAEGTYIIDVATATMDPFVVHFHEREVVAFQVHDPIEGGSARGTYAGHMPGVLRPLLQWDTRKVVEHGDHPKQRGAYPGAAPERL